MRAPRLFIVEPKHVAPSPGSSLLYTAVNMDSSKGLRQVGVVIATPLVYDGPIQVGDEVIVHHNIFRSFLNSQGKFSLGRSTIYDKKHKVDPEDIYLYDSGQGWKPHMDWCFVRPLVKAGYFLEGFTQSHTGEVVYSSEHPADQMVHFTPHSECEIPVKGEILYRMRNNDIVAYV